MRIGFDNDKYISMQSEHIKERISKFDNKLYLELGGKLFDDYHAARVLPGFQPDSKIKMLRQLSDSAEIVIAVSAVDIEKNKVRGDIGITYDDEVLRLIDAFTSMGLYVGSVVITQYAGQLNVELLKRRLAAIGMPTYYHYPISGYPSNIPLIVSDDGYGRNDYIKTTRPLVIVTAPGPGSGKMATCLSQLYHEYKRGCHAGYAKFETFPIWNIPLKHPVNLAYEAATADIKDVNMIDYFHLQAYGVQTVNYNRDIEVFPVVRSILSKLSANELDYKSPTDMGVNMAGYCIFDDEACQEASKQEVIRRYYKSCCDNKNGRVDLATVKRIELLMGELGIKPANRAVVQPALDKEAASGEPACAIELKDGTIVTGRDTKLMSAPASTILNALKSLAKLPDRLKLIAPQIVKPIMDLKQQFLHEKNYKLTLNEVLVALSICAATNEAAAMCVDCINDLAGCEMHSTRMLLKSDEDALRKIKVNLTSEPKFLSDQLCDF